MLSFSNTLIEMIKIIFFVVPFGILSSHIFLKNKAKSFFLFMPIYFLLGINLLIVLLFFIGLYIFNIYLLMILYIICIGLLLYLNRSSFSTYNLNKYRLNIKENIVPLSLLLLSIILFAKIAYEFEVSPPIDSLHHGMYTSLILYQEKIPTSFAPICMDYQISPLDYPFGFHILSALTCLINDTVPVRAMNILAALIIALIPPLSYTTIYLTTKSKILGFMGFLIFFILPSNIVPLWRLEFSLLISIYNVGIYSNLLGNYIFLGFCFLSIIYTKDNLKKSHLYLIIVFVISLFISYFPLIPLFLIPLIILFIFSIKNIKYKLLIFLTLTIAYMAMTYAFIDIIFNFFDYNPNLSYIRYTTNLNIESLTSGYWYYIPTLFLGVLSSVYSYKKNNIKFFSIVVIFISTCSLLSFNRFIFTNLLWFIQYPSRIITLGIILSFLAIIIFLKSSLPNKYHSSKYYIITTFFLILIFSSLLEPFVNFKPSDFSEERMPKGGLYEDFIWLTKNINADDLVLNEPSVAGQYLTTFKAQAVVNDRIRLLALNQFSSLKGTDYEKMVKESNYIFQNPSEYERISQITKKYDIKYILIINRPLIQKNDSYARVFYSFKMPTTYTIEEYLAIFDSNPYLTIFYNSSDMVVYRVI